MISPENCMGSLSDKDSYNWLDSLSPENSFSQQNNQQKGCSEIFPQNIFWQKI